ncbi:Protein of unknown function [Butyrivibrio sp. Su6]|nr:Protein of unknown function [Butyrivibrio sp. Su6]
MDKQILFDNIDRIHTTAMGVDRIKKNLSLGEVDVVDWCKSKIMSKKAEISKQGKNWYICIEGCIITVNASSYTIITAHKEKRRIKSTKITVKELTLSTGLIECGFTFGNRFRVFYAEQTGVRPFKFNVDMVASAKAVKENGDESFTLGDLLDIYYGKKIYVKYDKSALHWNKFVKDFCADDATKIFDERLKAAASLWSIVRDSDMKKEYSHELFEKYKDSITI